MTNRHRLHRCTVGEYRLRQHALGNTEMIVQHAFENRAQIMVRSG
jgi:hypothetical protein